MATTAITLDEFDLSSLGLPLVHSIVEQHRGSLAIERGAAGGARFVVRLPLAPSS